MANTPPQINSINELFFAQRIGLRGGSAELIVCRFLSNCSGLRFCKPAVGDQTFDITFGDGRNTLSLFDQDYAAKGIEVTEGVV